jgi:prophage regulatory protein
VLTSRNVAWDLAEVEKWIESRKESEDQPIRPGININASR